MPLLYNLKVFDDPIDTTRDYYTDPTLSATLAEADRLQVFVRVSKVASADTAMIDVTLEHSLDNENWWVRKNLAVSLQLPGGPFFMDDADPDAGATVGGAFYRLVFSVGGTSTRAYVEAWVTGRSS